MNKKLLPIALLAVTSLLFMQCRKNKNEVPAPVVPKIVYAAGNQYIGNHNVATIWKDNVATTLTNGTFNASGNSVFVPSTDVYVTGYEENVARITVAKLWKNGTATSLTDVSIQAEVNSVFVK